MHSWIQETRHSVRRLARRPGFTAVAVLTVGLGIGANTAIFSLVKTVLMEPLPYGSPERLVMVWERGPESDVTWLSAREVLEYRAATRSFEHVAASYKIAVNLTGEAEPERVVAAAVTGNLFDALGAPAAVGRALTPADDVPGGENVAVIGWDLWQRRWGGAPDLIGRSIRLNGEPHTVLGVMPPDFVLPLDYREERPTELWVPARIDPSQDLPWGSRGYNAVARLRPGVRPGQADADLDAAMRGWCEAGYLDDECGTRDRDAVPLSELILGGVRADLFLLFGAVGLVLLIACANLANLILARSDARRKEIATRAALGADRARLVRELLTESGIIAAIGAVVGLAIAWVGLRSMLALTPVNVIHMRDGVGLDVAVLGFTGLLAVATTLIAGLAPALQLSRPDLARLAGAGGRGESAPMRRRLRRGLVVAETAVSVVIVVGAVLLARSFVELRGVELGYETDNRLTFRIGVPAAEYPEAADVVGFYEQLLQRIEGLPGVRTAGAARVLPLTRTIGDWSITVEGRPELAPENPNGDWQVVTPGYFETMGIELLDGRFLTDADRADAVPVALVNETMAERYWPGGAVGRRFHLGTLDQPWITIVGVTRDIRHNAVIEEPRAEMYIPHAQFPAQTRFAPRSMTVVSRTAGDPRAVVPDVRAAVRSLDPTLPITDVRTMDAIAANALAPQRFSALLLSLFAGLAMTLAAVGLYGVISFGVARRRAEIGIRVALGARPVNVIRLVMREGVALTAIGSTIGLACAWALSRVLESLVYEVSARDPVAFIVAPIVLVGTAVLATSIPARRATRVDPLESMRAE